MLGFEVQIQILCTSMELTTQKTILCQILQSSWQPKYLIPFSVHHCMEQRCAIRLTQQQGEVSICQPFCPRSLVVRQKHRGRAVAMIQGLTDISFNMVLKIPPRNKRDKTIRTLRKTIPRIRSNHAKSCTSMRSTMYMCLMASQIGQGMTAKRTKITLKAPNWRLCHQCSAQ